MSKRPYDEYEVSIYLKLPKNRIGLVIAICAVFIALLEAGRGLGLY